MRAFVEKEIMPYCHEWDEAKAMPKTLFKKCAQANWLAAVIGTSGVNEHVAYLISGHLGSWQVLHGRSSTSDRTSPAASNRKSLMPSTRCRVIVYSCV